jgi:putative oxidoreductase
MAELAVPRNGSRRLETGLILAWATSQETLTAQTPHTNTIALAVLLSMLRCAATPSKRLKACRKGEGFMWFQEKRSSHPLLSATDGIAAGMSDILLLIARLLVAAVFLMTVLTGGPNAAYLKSINFISPDIMSPLAHVVEWIVVVTLVLGVATRYGALLAFAFVVIALITSHLYWEFPAAQNLQYVFLSKDLSIAGGTLALFVAGAGRFSIDHMLAGKR